MTREEVSENLGTIAHSGTKEFLSQLEEQGNNHLVGQFGVGFYSSFIVANEVQVLTRHAGSPTSEGVSWVSTGKDHYTLKTVERLERGTEITLTLKPEEDEFLNDWRLRTIITKYSDHIAVPVQMKKPAPITDDESKEKG